MPLTLSLSDTMTGTLVRTLTREAENREQECIQLSNIVKDAMNEIARLENTLSLVNEAQDLAHDRMEELTYRETTNVELKRQIQELEIENSALIDLLVESDLEQDEMIQEILDLTSDLEYVESFANPNPYTPANTEDFDDDFGFLDPPEFPLAGEAVEENNHAVA